MRWVGQNPEALKLTSVTASILRILVHGWLRATGPDCFLTLLLTLNSYILRIISSRVPSTLNPHSQAPEHSKLHRNPIKSCKYHKPTKCNWLPQADNPKPCALGPNPRASDGLKLHLELGIHCVEVPCGRRAGGPQAIGPHWAHHPLGGGRAAWEDVENYYVSRELRVYLQKLYVRLSLPVMLL